MKKTLITINEKINGATKGFNGLSEDMMKKLIKADVIDLTWEEFNTKKLSADEIETLKSFCKIPKKPLTAEERAAEREEKKRLEKEKKAAERKLTKNHAMYIVVDKLSENPDTIDNICKNVFDVYCSDKTDKTPAKNDWFKFACVSNIETLLHYGFLSYDEKTKMYKKVK